MIDYDYDALVEAIDEEPGSVEEAPEKKDVRRLGDHELDDAIQRFRLHIQDNSLKVDKTRLRARLEALEAESDRRDKAKRNGARPLLQKITEKRSIDSDQNTPRKVKERKTEVGESEKDAPAFQNELKIMVFHKKKKSIETDSIKIQPRLFPTTPVQTSVPDVAKQHRLPQQVSIAEELAARRKQKASTPDTVVVYSSDDENDVKVMENCTRRSSLRIAERKRIDSSMKIAYPSKDDPDAVEVYYADFTRLNPAEFLNDTVIDFYIKFLQTDLHTERIECCHFYSSFFFRKLEEAFESETKQQNEAFSKLRKWTKGIDIFSKSYLFLPINDRLHWSLAIICFSLSDGGLRPFLFHLDSLENGHSSKEIFKYILKYLQFEHAEMEIAIDIRWRDVIKRRVEVPRQENESDCGLFLLYYIRRFVESAPVPCQLTTDTSSLFGRRWFKPSDASGLRSKIRKLLEDLFIAAAPE